MDDPIRRLRHELRGTLNAMSLSLQVLSLGVSRNDALDLLNLVITNAEAGERLMGEVDRLIPEGFSEHPLAVQG